MGEYQLFHRSRVEKGKVFIAFNCFSIEFSLLAFFCKSFSVFTTHTSAYTF